MNPLLLIPVLPVLILAIALWVWISWHWTNNEED